MGGKGGKMVRWLMGGGGGEKGNQKRPKEVVQNMGGGQVGSNPKKKV